ncbi:MAG: sensor histidine kinase [Pseudobacter sp.]|uniref:sensor histidine kinase n=1 Tax=Pseudobacter sp. TaxID=2045420 RepID=UPI003F7F024E
MKLQSLIKRLDVFLYLGLYCWLAVAGVIGITGNPAASFDHYGKALVTLLISLSPVLIFVWNRPHWRDIWSHKKYRAGWMLCFLVFVPLLMLAASICTNSQSYFCRDIIFTGGIFTLLLELILLLNSWLRRKRGQWQWIRSISLEKAIFISITLITVILSVMAVSSTGNPEFDQNGKLLIGFVFDGAKLLQQPLVFFWFLLQFLFMYACGYFYFHVNNRFLVPMVLRQHGVLLYSLAGLALVSISYPLIGALLHWLPINERLGYVFPADPFRLDNAFGAVLILLLSLPVLLALQWARQNNRITALEKEKSETELALLKQQLNPHFFFNTLNNLYALSLQQSKQTPESILQLSELMRYVIYRAKEPEVAVVEEVKYIEDYIQLQQIRMKHQPEIIFMKNINTDTPRIAPLLLIVLVENAFKHGVEPAEEKSMLHLQLVTTATSMYFSCINSFEQETDSAAGIGLQNLERRLQLLYPGKHRLKTAKENHIFKAELELDLT